MAIVNAPGVSANLYYGVATSAGAADGSTIIDTSLSTPFTADDVIDGHTVRILTSSIASLVGQEREIHDFDYGTTTMGFSLPFTSQVPAGTTYSIVRSRPSSAGSPGPSPEPEIEEPGWQLSDFDNFDVADASADTVRWSSEYISAGAADGSADINTTTSNKLYANITAAAVAAAEYGVRRLQLTQGTKWFTKVDCATTVTSENANYVWAGLSVSRGIAWDASNYIRIYKRKSNAVEGIAVESNIAGGGVTTTTILSTTQTDIAFKIERIGNIWRTYYSLTNAPRHRWVLAKEIEDATDSMTDDCSIYLSVYDAEDAAGQQITCNFDKWELYHTLGTLESIFSAVSLKGGALAFIGYCPVGMAASTTAIVTNLVGFGNDVFNTGYQMIVLRNNNSLAAAPEMEMRDITDYVSATGTFTTAAFSSNVEASDVVLVIHNSVASKAVVYGIADAGSTATTIRDAARTEVDDYWNSMTIVMLSGDSKFQARAINDFVAATDDIQVHIAFTNAIAAGDVYCILSQCFPVPGMDETSNTIFPEVIGNKTDTSSNVEAATDSLVSYAKGALTRGMVLLRGICSNVGGSTTAILCGDLRGFGDDFFNSRFYMQVLLNANSAGNAPEGEIRQITDYASAGFTFTTNAFSANVEANDILLIWHESAIAIGQNNADNIFSSSSVVPNADGSVLERLEDMMVKLVSGRLETLPSHGEFWIDEAGIPAQYWSSATTATGTVARDATEAGYMKVLVNCPAAVDTAKLYSVQRWRVSPGDFGTNTIQRKTFLEFELKTGTLANLDNAIVFLGFGDGQGDIRSTAGIIGFIFAADAITAVTDAAGVETTTDVSAGITVTNYNKYRIEVYAGGVKFYVNETLVATHVTNLSDGMKYINYSCGAEAATGATSLSVPDSRAWYQDEV